jgi:uncharacterized protein YjbI with pentapeptide repeats
MDCILNEAELGGATFCHGQLRLTRLYAVQAEEVNFNYARMLSCDFVRAVLSRSRFQRAHLGRSVFGGARLDECDFRDANLDGVDFTRASLTRSRFAGASMRGTDLRWANLEGAREMTPAQLLQARTSDDTILPNGKLGPYLKRSGAERPVRSA